MKIQVIKRDGLKEDYSQEKIARVVAAAGLSPEQAQELSAKVTDWIFNSHLSEITSLQIRDRVIKELRKINPNIAHLFIWYEKTKDKEIVTQ
jgi:transcriptional regulator NrdR family protein